MILDLFTRELFPIFCIWKNASALPMAPAPVNSINILKQYQQRHCIVNCIKEPTAERKIKSMFTFRLSTIYRTRPQRLQKIIELNWSLRDATLIPSYDN